MKKVAVIMGSDSDWPIVKQAVDTLKSLDIPFEAKVLSAHRTPGVAMEFARLAREAGFGAIIAAAGKAAHLAGVLAGNTTLPVIGLPIGGAGGLGGLDALLATVQMPSGIPVATVAIDGAKNAALLAAQILGVTEPSVAEKLSALRAEMEQSIAEKNEALQQKL
jgi:5-(carboxyamino)imidazole ribonucleotide mutase